MLWCDDSNVTPRKKYERAWKRAEALGLTEQLADMSARCVETFERATRDYENVRWGDEPDALIVLEAPLVYPGEALACLGVLEQLEYSGSKGHKHHIWFHPFEPEKPQLAVNSECKLVIVGGDYTVNDRGIVG